MVFWSGCPDLMDMKDAELERWHRRGVDGFVCTIGHLFKLGGEHRFTGDLNAISGKNYNWERYLRISNIVARAQARHEDVPRVLLREFAEHPDAARRVVRRRRLVEDRAPGDQGPGRRRQGVGFDGFTFDQELYPQSDGRSTASWSWAYDGNTHTEAEVRSR